MSMASTIWKGYLTFGLVSIPIKLFRAARAEKVHMHHLQRGTGARVRQVFVPQVEEITAQLPAAAPATGPSLVAAKKQADQQSDSPKWSREVERADPEAVPPSELVHGFEFEKGKYVAFEPEELEKLAPQTTPDMEVIEFVRFGEVDPVYLETSYYVAADKGGEKAYSLLFETLKTGYAAIAEFVMHRRDQTMILRAGKDGIIGHTLFYDDEVKHEYAFHADSSLVSPREMVLAEKLVGAMATNFDPAKFKDKFRQRLQGAISAKIEAGALNTIEPAVKTTPVVDIMAALEASLKAARKPVRSAGNAQSVREPERKKSSRG